MALPVVFGYLLASPGSTREPQTMLTRRAASTSACDTDVLNGVGLLDEGLDVLGHPPGLLPLSVVVGPVVGNEDRSQQNSYLSANYLTDLMVYIIPL